MPRQITAVAALSLLGLGSLTLPAAASLFGEIPIQPGAAIALARPLRNGTFDLLVLEQLPGGQKCWQTREDAAGTVDPLLINFDFTGICERGTDSNGYSLRVAGRDLGLEYRLQVRPQGGYVELQAVPARGSGAPVVIGRSRGFTSDFLQIDLNPGWQLTRRTFEGQRLGHFYLSTADATAMTVTAPASLGIAAAPQPRSASLTPSSPRFGTGEEPQNPSAPVPIAVVRLYESNPSMAVVPASSGTALPVPPRPSFTPTQPLPAPSTPTLAPLRTSSSPTTTAIAPRPTRFDLDAQGRLNADAYLVVVPASGDPAQLTQQLRSLGVPAANLFERRVQGVQVALGPFRDRQLAEQWREFLRQRGQAAADVYFGR